MPDYNPIIALFGCMTIDTKTVPIIYSFSETRFFFFFKGLTASYLGIFTFRAFMRVVTRGSALDPGTYSWRYILKNKINKESRSGPKITPQKPNMGIPISTPNTVING